MKGSFGLGHGPQKPANVGLHVIAKVQGKPETVRSSGIGGKSYRDHCSRP